MDSLFDTSIKELGYIYTSLDNLGGMIVTEIEAREDYYEHLGSLNKFEVFLPDNIPVETLLEKTEYDKENYIKKKKQEDSAELVTISSTILEAILIRQVSIVEKYLVDLSFLVFNECTKELKTIYQAPNVKVDNNKRFTDCIRACNSIKNNIGYNIKDAPQWKIFIKLRNLRHKLAHGEQSIEITQDELKEYNKKFRKHLFMCMRDDSENKLLKKYRLYPNYPLQLEINKYFKAFIEYVDHDVKNYFKE